MSRLVTPTTRPYLARKDEVAAFVAGAKRTFRVPVTHENSIVTPGHFRGLDLETGRRRMNPTPELRARCTFENAQARAVTVKPKVKAGDLFWVRSGRDRVDQSRMTLEVLAVDVCRLQDITAEEVLWESTKVKSLWASNPWVWVYRVRVPR